MSATIHQFPRRPEHDRDAENKARNLKKVLEIERRIESGRRRFPSRKDPMIAAAAIRNLVERARQHGLPQFTIEIECEERGLPCPRLQRHMTKSEKDRRKGTDTAFTTKIENYLDIASSISVLLDCDPVEEKARVLSGTSIWGSPDKAEGSDVRAEELALLLQEACARVIRDTNFAESADRMTEVPGTWEALSRTFRDSRRPCLPRKPYLEWYEHWEEAPPFPYVPLLAIPHASFSRPVRVSPAMDGHDVFDATFHLEREIGICLGLTMTADSIGPMFETRARASVSIMGANALLIPQWSLDDGFDVVLDGVHRKLVPEAALHEISLEKTAAAIGGKSVEDPFLWDFTPLEMNSPQCFEHYYFSWTPVDAAYVAHWLHRLIGDVDSLLPGEYDPKDQRATWFTASSFAQSVELALHDGSFIAALTTSVRDVEAAFMDRHKKWRIDADDASATLLAEFRSDLLEAADDEEPATQPEGQLDTDPDSSGT